MIDLVHMQTFVAVVEEKGFSAGARRLGVAKSLCSKRINDLEEQLGVRLLHRTTRAVTPTDMGVTYLSQCRDILAAVDTANASVSTAAQEIAGPLRLTLPLSFSDSRLEPILDAFMRLYPRVSLDLQLSDARVDLVSAGFDAGIRIGDLTDSSLVARKVGETQLILCAAPEYLNQRGAPETPEDLNDHDCLLFTNLASRSVWVFERDEEKIRKRVRARAKSDNGALLRGMAIAGHGIAMLPGFLVGPCVDDGRLQQVMPDYQTARFGIHVVYPARRNLRATVRAFVDHMANSLA
ncbi:MAG: LysR family transcriptional regulator [Magnetospiraceae bacterium]